MREREDRVFSGGLRWEAKGIPSQSLEQSLVHPPGELERERGVRGNEVTEWNAEEARPLARIKGGLGRAQIVSG